MKEDYQKALKKVISFFLWNPVPLNRQNYQKQKGQCFLYVAKWEVSISTKRIWKHVTASKRKIKFHKKCKKFDLIFIKVGLSPSKRIVLFGSQKVLLKMMKKVKKLILKALFVLKIFKRLS